MNCASIRTTTGALLLSLFFAACGGAKGKGDPNPTLLISQGKFREARALVQHKASMSPADRAVLALCLVAENPTAKRATEAVTAMVEGAQGNGTVAASLDLLRLAFYLPTPVAGDVSMTLVEVALGSVGVGGLAKRETTTLEVNAMSKRLGVAALERTHLALTGPGARVDANRLMAIWNGSFALFGGSFSGIDVAEAWTLFHSLGNLAIVVSQSDPRADLSTALVIATISVLNTNQSIAIPARCDLSSPFDRLKSVIAHNRELSTRLESSVAVAQGCTRGTYAPEPN